MDTHGTVLDSHSFVGECAFNRRLRYGQLCQWSVGHLCVCAQVCMHACVERLPAMCMCARVHAHMHMGPCVCAMRGRQRIIAIIVSSCLHASMPPCLHASMPPCLHASEPSSGRATCASVLPSTRAFHATPDGQDGAHQNHAGWRPPGPGRVAPTRTRQGGAHQNLRQGGAHQNQRSAC